MQLHELSTPRKGAKNRVGRGIAAGQGKTAGRGTKGQKSRTGYKAPKRIPGMMSASDYRLPKAKGFHSHRPEVVGVTLGRVDAAFADGETVSPDTLVQKKVIKGYGRGGVKILASGSLTKRLSFENLRLTKVASERIGQALPKKEATTKPATA